MDLSYQDKKNMLIFNIEYHQLNYILLFHKGLSTSDVCFLDLEERFQNGPSTTCKKVNFQCYAPVSIFFKMDISYQNKKNILIFQIRGMELGLRIKMHKS